MLAETSVFCLWVYSSYLQALIQALNGISGVPKAKE